MRHTTATEPLIRDCQRAVVSCRPCRSRPTIRAFHRRRSPLRVASFIDEAKARGPHAQQASAQQPTKLKVAVFSAGAWLKPYVEPELKDMCSQLSFYDTKLQRETARLAEGCDAITVFVHDVCDRQVAEMLAQQGVKLICLRSTGSTNLDVEAANAAGIRVARVPKFRVTSVAEHAMALVFGLNRKLHISYTRVAQGNYSLSGLVGEELFRKKVGIIGTGSVGSELCRMMLGVGCSVLAYDRAPSPKMEAMGVQYVGLEQLLSSCDIVSLHLAADPSNRHFINAARLRQMKPGAMLVNVSAGELVDVDAVMDALETAQLGSFGTDVYEREGLLFDVDWQQRNLSERMHAWDRKFRLLLSYPQVLVTPHTAFLTQEGVHHISRCTAQNLAEFATGLPLSNEIKPHVPLHGPVDGHVRYPLDC